MKIRTRYTKLRDRLLSLEQHLGVVHSEDDGYSEHVNREYGELPNLLKDVKALKEDKTQKEKK